MFKNSICGEVEIDEEDKFSMPVVLISKDIKVGMRYNSYVIRKDTIARIMEQDGDDAVLLVNSNKMFGWTSLKENTNYRPIGIHNQIVEV
jgi:hypothetical protein